MEWIRVFKIYNIKNARKNYIIHIFLMVSIIISASLSLAIPQIISSTESYLLSKSYEINGADLKIEASFENVKFKNKIEEIKKNYKIKSSSVYNSSIKNGKNEVYSDLLIGDYKLEDNQAVIYNELASKLEIKTGDTISISNHKYKVSKIEKTPIGVGKQSETMGYVKVNSFKDIKADPYSKIYFINGNNINDIKQNLKKIENKYTYTTIKDQQKEIQSKLDMNVVSLNLLNSMCFVMTIFSVISSIFMIVLNRKNDIAIMKLTAIKSKSIKNAMILELSINILVSIVFSIFFSLVISKFILLKGNIYKFAPNILVSLEGAFLLFAIYWIFIQIVTKVVEDINALLVLKDDGKGLKLSKTSVIMSIIFTILTFLIYAMYLGRGSALTSSIIIIIFITILLVIGLLILKFIFLFKNGGKLRNYTLNNIRKSKYSTLFTILCLTFTVWFILVGFTMSNTLGKSYSESMSQKIKFNYVVIPDKPESFEKVLNNKGFDIKSTKMYQKSGVLFLQGSPVDSISLCKIKMDEYHVAYNLLEGKNLYKGSKDEVLISKELSDKQNIFIGDKLKINLRGEIKTYKIKGIYESGGINQNNILLPYTGNGQNNDYDFISYLIYSSSSEFKNHINDASIINVNIMGAAITDMIGNFLNIFKWICLVCLVASITFNINLVYITIKNNFKEYVVIRALGLGKKFLYKVEVLKYFIILLISIVLSIGIYLITAKVIIKAMFHAELIYNINSMGVSILIAFIVITSILFIPIINIKKLNNFDALREQD